MKETLQTYDWHFPLPRTHTGMLLGNAVTGAMVWGENNTLRVTLGRADFWDHRGGLPWTPAMNYRNIRDCLAKADPQKLQQIFSNKTLPEGHPRQPSVLPIGRLDIEFPEDVSLTRGTLHMDTGHIVLELAQGTKRLNMRLDMAATRPVLLIQLPAGLPAKITRVPAWNYVGEHLASISFTKPAPFDLAGFSGWIQERPADEPLCVGYRQDGRSLWVSLEYGTTPDTARTKTRRLIDQQASLGPETLRRRNLRWWNAYWKDIPSVRLPNERLAFIYRYGMYKFAGLTAPHGVAATLQGPWIEEYQMPPWSSDYHFNINVQMCYWPAYAGNRLEHLRPILDLVWSWRDKLRSYARMFIGVRDGYMLPHAVDDRGTVKGGFWTGTMDHGCTAWVGKMMFDYWRYGGDKAYLRDVAYPFLKGAMRVYEAMLEEKDGRFELPFSVSPEYGGCDMNAWGKNASFQLAAIHWLIEALLEASRVLKVKPKPIWSKIQKGLPLATVAQHPGNGKPDRIMLWEGQDLDESHRHHSHLAGYYPFDVIDPDAPEWRRATAGSCRWWNEKGTGWWTGWCVPWAAMLQSRIGIPEMTEHLLTYWDMIFTNEGHGTLHDPPTWTANRMRFEGLMWREKEVMQAEAGMAAAAAVMDMLVHVRRGVHHLFPGVPKRWRNASFDGIRTEGGFLVSAELKDTQVERVKVRSTIGDSFRIANPWNDTVRVKLRVNGKTRLQTVRGNLITLKLPRGASAELMHSN